MTMKVKRYNPEPFSQAMPAVAVYDPVTGRMVKYVHSQKELEKATDNESEGGEGYGLEYRDQAFPVFMNHPVLKDVCAKDEAEAEKYRAKGYTSDPVESFKNNILNQAIGKMEADPATAIRRALERKDYRAYNKLKNEADMAKRRRGRG